MNTYTFTTGNNSNNNIKKFFTFSFLKKNKPTDYSEVLDDIILTNLMETNSYLKDYKTKQHCFTEGQRVCRSSIIPC